MRVLLTGISGFIGSPLADRLLHDGHSVVGVVRKRSKFDERPIRAGVELSQIDDIVTETDWASRTKGIGAVIHLAARVHVMHETQADPLESFRRVNLRGTMQLAEGAAAAGVRRFIYISTIKVNGEQTIDKPFVADDPPAPQDAYAISKHEAENALRTICARTNMELVIIRPPLVYGPGVKGNFDRLLRLVSRGTPLPLGAVDNRRSMVSLKNVVDFIAVCLLHPNAANQAFLVSDGDDWSTPQLISAIAEQLDRAPRLFAFPPALLKAVAGLLGKRALVARLCDSLRVDIEKNRDLLNWQPAQSAAEGLAAAVQAFLLEGSYG